MNERFLEAVGPIVVKEVRQGLRARVFAIAFGLLLLACLTTSLVAAAEVREWSLQPLGPRYLTLFLAGLSLVCFFVIPYTAYRSMAREREDETWVLLALTGLSSRRIVRGKVASALTQAVLYSSAGAPFILFSYFLNGVDLPTLGVEMLLGSSWAVFVTSVAVALGTEGHSKIGRAIVHFLVLGLLGLATFAGIGFGAEIAERGANMLNQDSFVIFVFAFSAALWSTSVLVLEGAAAGLALASDATVKGARLVACAQVVIGVSVTFLGASLTTPTQELASVGSVFSSLFLVGFGGFSIAERDGYPRSVKSRSGFTSGAFRGWKLTMALLWVCTVAWALLHHLIHGINKDRWIIFAAPLYVALYLSLAVVVGRLSPLRRMGEPIATRAAFFILVGSAAVIFPLVSVMAGERPYAPRFNLLNPIFGSVNYVSRLSVSEMQDGLTVLGPFAAVCMVLAWVVLQRRDEARI